MVKLKADGKGRLKIPDIKAGQVFVLEDRDNGVYVLTEVEKIGREPFPEGSLKHLFTKEYNAEMEAFARGIKFSTPPED
jgi:hypothetical protein